MPGRIHQWQAAFLRGYPKIGVALTATARAARKSPELLPTRHVADDLTFVVAPHGRIQPRARPALLAPASAASAAQPPPATYGLGSENSIPRVCRAVVRPLAGAARACGAPASPSATGRAISLERGARFLENPVATPRGIVASRDTVRALNEAQLADVGDPEIATRISQYEWRSGCRPPCRVDDISRESPATLALYGAQPGKASFGNNCLLAHRLIERGVRLVQLYDAD